MNESLKEKIKRIAKDKLGIRSWRDQVDENFANGTKVASAPFAKLGTVFGRTAGERVNYMKKINRMNASDNTPRDIIRNDKGSFPIDFATESQKARVADVMNFRNDTGIYDASKEAIKSGTLDENGNVSEYMVKRPREKVARFSGNKVIDWNEWLKQKKEGKEAGKEIAKQFSEQNKKEKAKYRQISMGATYSNSFIPDGYTGKLYKVTSKTDPSSSSIITQKQLDNADEELKTLWKVEDAKPTKALGGQNTKYLDRDLHEDSNQDINNMAASAKPIHYDENGNPYVRGFTWTQTENVPKITNPNAGYLASVGADTKIYHAGATPGHWTSEGWGNPMDKNYENNVAPGEIEKFNLSDIEESLEGKIDMSNGGEWERLQELKERAINGIKGGHYDYNSYLMDLANKYNVPTSQNFDEQLLETRWPIKWYQKAPSEHQPNAGEMVTIMNAGPGAKDIHRPVIKEVSDSRSNREFEALQNEFMDRFQLPQEALMHQYRRKIDSEGWSPELEEWYKSERKKFTEDPEFSRMYKLISLGPKKVPTTVGTQVDKIATPASMITAHMEDNMPRNWSMRDWQNGGQSIAGWHPNKEWSSWNAEDFADHVKSEMPELYNELVAEAEKEFGKSIDSKKNAKNIHNYIGQYFIDNPDYLEIMADMAEGKPLGKTFKNPYEFSNWHNQRPLPEGQN